MKRSSSATLVFSLLSAASGFFLGACTAPSTPSATGTSPAVATVPAGDKVYGPNEVDLRPKPVQEVAPVFPADLRDSKIPGKVVFSLIVNADGTVREMEILGSTHPAFGAAAAAALQQWKFSPGLKDGQPVATRIEETISFTK